MQSPEGSHFLGVGVSVHIGSPGGQSMHGAHMGIPMQCPAQPTMPAGEQWPVPSQAMGIGGGGQPPSVWGSHGGLHKDPQASPWHGSGGMHMGAPGAHIPCSLQVMGIVIGIIGAQLAPQGFPSQASLAAQGGSEVVQVTLPSQTPAAPVRPHDGWELGQESVMHGAPQGCP